MPRIVHVRELSLALLGVAFVTGAASADFTYAEVGNAGGTPSGAQTPMGTGALTQITGSLAFGGDADVFQIAITNPAQFSASAIASLGTQAPPIFLFNASGLALAQARGFSSGESGSGPAPSLIDATFVTTPGIYFLAIATQQATARDAANALIFSATPGAGTQTAPSGPAAGSTIASFNTPFVAGGAYVINLTGAGAVPTPSAAGVLALGALGAARRRRR